MDTITYFRELDLFEGLSEEELEVCKRTFPMFTASRGRMLFTPTRTEHALYIIKQGAVRLYRLSPDGRELTLGRLGQGDVFGTLPMFGALSRNTFAEAGSDVLVCMISEDQLRDLIARHPEIGLRLLRIVGDRLAAAEDQIEDLAFRSAEQRVARSVIRMLDGSRGSKLSVSHEEIGRQAGVARETVTKVLRGMERQGWVKTGYRSLRVLAREPLEGAAAD